MLIRRCGRRICSYRAEGSGWWPSISSDIAPKIVRYVPLNAWFRFRRAVEDTPTILMVMEQEANAKICASLVLRLKAKPAIGAKQERGADAKRGLVAPACPENRRASCWLFARFGEVSVARLLKGFPLGGGSSEVACAVRERFAISKSKCSE